MMYEDEREFIKQAFQKLKERGWFLGEEQKPSPITIEEIADFEKQHQVILPSFYKAFLTSYCLPTTEGNELMAIVDSMGELEPLWLMLDSPTSMKQISRKMDDLQIIRDFCKLPEGCFQNLIPIGDWGAGWGPLCIDLSISEDNAKEDDEATWSLVWFDHEEFDWDKCYLGNDGLLHGTPAAPNLRTLLEWYFCGSLETEFEKEVHVTPTYEWYQSGAEYD